MAAVCWVHTIASFSVIAPRYVPQLLLIFLYLFGLDGVPGISADRAVVGVRYCGGSGSLGFSWWV